MKIARCAGLGMAMLISACATPQPEVRMIPTADHGVGVRFSRGASAMVSYSPTGAVMLIPIQYNSASKLYFTIAAFNTSAAPVNIGSEDVHIYMDGTQALRVQDFNYLRQESKRAAEREMAAAWVSVGLEGYLSYQAAENHPRGTEIAFRRASGELYMSRALIEMQLRQAIAERGRLVLQTTTVDPGSRTGGFIFADQVAVPDGVIRPMTVEVNFGGYPHQFTINLASSATDAEVPINIPAVPAQRMQAMQRTPETWHFQDGPPPSKVDGMEVID
jgi:hypothetical protein